MERDEVDDTGFANISGNDNQALNPTILEYYKKFGKKRDLEQYFSLSTAQGEVKDPTSLFWRRMKSQTDSSDSGEKSRESSLEVCRISIRCSAPDTDAPSSQDDNHKTKSDTESPPIIIEEVPLDTSRHTDDEYAKSDDNNSQKSIDAMLDTSMNKPLSPSSSITSQRKLEWDSLADVGYANESDKKTSASSLSTLERLALKQQYSNNDTKDENLMGVPTAHSTPVDENDKSKGKRGSKTTKIYRRDVEFVEFNMPHSSNANPSQSINVNLTKHISFNVEKAGAVIRENVKKDVSISPDKTSTETNVTPDGKLDKEIQTSLIKTKDESIEAPKSFQLYGQAVPVLINLNTLKKRNRKKKLRTVKKKVRSRKKFNIDKENLPVLEKSGEQVSEAESFEYMPGHIYNQNQLNKQPVRISHAAGNKSSLESSGAVTTDSSKRSKLSFTKDLEKSIKLLKVALHKRYNDSELKDKLIKDVVERLLKSSYKDDETTTDFLSGLSYSSKKLGLGEGNTTTSTSDANNTAEKTKRPKKSILRVDKFNPTAIASTSQSAPNIPSVTNSEKLVASRLAKALTSSNTESDVSSKDKTSPDTAFARTSSEELYQKYLNALRRENAYKRHLRDKEMFLKQKLVSSDTAFNMPVRLDPKSQTRIKELMNDLTRNNYDDGSGDASKLEGGLGSNNDLRYGVPRSQRSHSVFTLSSSGNSDPNRKSNLKKSEMKDSPKAGQSTEEKHYCCCPHHNKMGVTDSSVQVNIKCGSEKSSPRRDKEPKPCNCGQRSRQVSPRPITRIVSDNNTGDIKYVCLCNNNVAEVKGSSDNVMIYKCSRLTNKGIQSQCAPSQRLDIPKICTARSRNLANHSNSAKFSKCSQTNLKVVCPEPIDEVKEKVCIHEAVRIVQTDISIDPKISDPVLTDIKIVNQNECVKLVREQYRQVSKSSIASDANAQPDQNILTSCPCSEASVDTPSTSSCCSKKRDKKSRENRGVGETVDVEIQSTMDIPTPDTVEDNFTIPIQGTNIMLKVSVGPNAVKVLETLENVDPRATANAFENNIVGFMKKYSNAVVTDAINTAENATCLTEECSKGVQSQNDDIFSQFDTKQSLLRALFTSDEYPNLQSTSAVNARRPLLRANTSTCILNRNTQNDFSDNAVPSQQQISMETMTEKSNTYPKSQDVQFNRRELPPGMVHQIPMGVFRFQGPERMVMYDKLFMKDSESYVSVPKPQQNRNIGEQTQCAYFSGTIQSDKEENTEHAKCKTVHYMTNLSEKSAFVKDSEENFSDQYEVPYGESSYALYPNTAAQELKKSQCGCSTTGLCKGECGEDAACRNQKSVYTGPEPPLQTIEERYYSDDASELHNSKAIFGQDEGRNKKSVLSGPNPSPRINDGQHCSDSNGLRSAYSLNEGTEIRNQSCGCDISGPCEGKCEEDSACRKRKLDGTHDSSHVPTVYPESYSLKVAYRPTESADTRAGDFALKIQTGTDPLYRQPIDEDRHFENNYSNSYSTKAGHRPDDNTETQKKTFCGCATSGPCKGECGKNAACRRKTSDYVAEEKSQEQMSDYTDIEKHFSQQFPHNENAIRNQTLPKSGVSVVKDDAIKSARSQSLPQGTIPISDPDSQNIVTEKKEIANIETEETDNSSMQKKSKSTKEKSEITHSKDLIMNVIQDITNRYSKKDIEKSQRKKCFKEIISLLNYLLDTEDSTDTETIREIKNIITASSSSELDPAFQINQRKEDIRNPVSEFEKRDRPKSSCSKSSTARPKSPLSRPNSPKPRSKSPSRKETKSVGSCTNPDANYTSNKVYPYYGETKQLVNKGIQISSKKSRSSKFHTESSDVPISTDIPYTSSDSATCKVLNKIRKECEKYHQKRCKAHNNVTKKCECTSTTSLSCDQCKRVHHCTCRTHKCKGHRPKSVCEKPKKKCVAYNLIIQTSESMISEETKFDKSRPLKNIIVKVPPKRKPVDDAEPYKLPSSPRPNVRSQRSRSLPNENYVSSTDDGTKTTVFTVRDYLERNRPDFVDQTTKRQNCLKLISEARPRDPCMPCPPCNPCLPCPPRVKTVIVHGPSNIGGCLPTQPCSMFCEGVQMNCDPCDPSNMRSEVTTVGESNIYVNIIIIVRANERAIQRELLSMQVQMDGEPTLKSLSESDLRKLARKLGLDLRHRQVPPKFISEIEMKKHSEKIYKKLPEVMKKKEDLKKENIKKTNLLMANIFKKNLQKKVLHGAVNLSNYSKVIKI